MTLAARFTPEESEPVNRFRAPGVRYKPADGFEHYLVGDDGSVWSKARGPWHRIESKPDAHGYLIVKLCREGNVRRTKLHILVARTFIGPRPGRLEVCHNDGNRKNCAVSNLRYDTHRGNHADRRQHGTSNAGEKNGMARFTEESVRRLRARAAEGATKKELIAEFGAGRRCINRILRGDRWGHVQ